MSTYGYYKRIKGNSMTYAAGSKSNRNIHHEVVQDNTVKYGELLVNPFSLGEARIPDVSSYPTSHFMQTEEYTMTVPTAVNAVAGIVVNISCAPNAQGESATSTSGALNYSASSAFTGNVAIQGSYKSMRLVAAGMIVEFTGNDQNNQGTLYMNYLTNLDTVPTSPSAIVNGRDSYSGPVKMGGFVRYRPLDANDFIMRSSTDTSYKFGYFQFHADGLASTATFRVKVCLHWEGLVQNDNFAAGDIIMSPSDSVGLDATINVVSSIDTTGALSGGPKQMDDEGIQVGSKILDYINIATGPTAQAISGAIATGAGALAPFNPYFTPISAGAGYVNQMQRRISNASSTISSLTGRRGSGGSSASVASQRSLPSRRRLSNAYSGRMATRRRVGL